MQKFLKLWAKLTTWWHKINSNDIDAPCPKCGYDQHKIMSQTRDPVYTGFAHRFIITLKCTRCGHIWRDSKE